ncbi:anaerobic carbon-monoxide dehydrogenase catalytic subunit [Desulforamulus aeronauticus]|uniref:Carbon monoxide dehydrogenase n=1 Tax=Desulforamulus aeronauticus DSM 10349 TaxID=1121421 RepID=A0A1M6SCI8_9FIRM|nr:anaerobic carbon-monoxide dehydrogenase catalytic subunit [Desulforamulus aeronauticus]SHK42484.1 Ni-dependent carbon monoxide dehydrogenase precursor [Desulforamulus aeronauticus DSM 10349]
MKGLPDVKDLSMDSGVQQMLEKARAEGIETAFDRAIKMSQCGFGATGVCCKHCLEGPCRIAPNGKGAQAGVCGAGVDTIVARNFLGNVTEGTASHAEHAREVAHAILEVVAGKAPYTIQGVEKLKAVASGLGLSSEGKDTNQLAKEVADKAMEDFQKQHGTLNWLELRAQDKSKETWEKLGLLPVNAHLEIAKSLARQVMGGDADPANLLLGAVTMGLVDGFAGLHMSTDLQDILFGTPTAVKSQYRLGVIKEDMVNLSVHGHIPLLSEKVVEWAGKLTDKAKEVGATGINVVGVCCSGNEVLMRRGVPVATNYASQELPIVTGALEAMVVDIQCIMPGIQTVASCYHTEIITTLAYSKIAGATHVEFTAERADEAAKEIVLRAIANFPKRDPRKVNIPNEVTEAYAGFSVEQIVEALRAVNPEEPLKPLVDAIAGGQILGAVAIVGCTNPRKKQDHDNVALVKELIKNNVLVVATGCSAHSLGKFGLLSPEGLQYCGEGLRNVLTAVGQANGLPGLPPALHMGSCVDNSRVADLLVALANYLGVAVKDLPAAGSCPETHHPKALSIGTYFIACGVDVHVGVNPQATGSPLVVNVLTADKENFPVTTDGLFGGKLIYEEDPVKAAGLLIERIKQKRKALGLN